MTYQIKEEEKQAAFTLKKALAYAYDILTMEILNAGYGAGTADALGNVLTRAIRRLDEGVIEESDCDLLMDAESVYHKSCLSEAKESGNLNEVRKERDACNASMQLLKKALEEISGGKI